MTDTLMTKQNKLLIGALFCGILNHIMFYQHAWGLSYPLFMLVFYIYFYWAVKERSEPRFDPSLLMILPIMLLSLTYVAFTNMLFIVLNAVAIPCLVAIQTTSVMRRPAVRWHDGGIVVAVLEQLFVHTLSYVPVPITMAVRALTGKMNRSRSRQLWKVLAGVLISLPILLLVGSLLASADTMFDHAMAQLPALLGDLDLFSFLFRMCWIAVVSITIFAYVHGLLHPKGNRQQEQEGAGWDPGLPAAQPMAELSQPAKSRGLDATVTATVLCILNAVYVLFAVLQFSYFFAGGSADLPDGVTYAEYARRGFAELVCVTVINFALLMVTLHGADRSSRSMDRVLRILLAMLICCTGVMLCSAFFRLQMYEEAYGYTVTRLLVHSFMIFLAVLFTLALYKVWNNRFLLMKPYLIAVITAYVLLNYIQIDSIIAFSNIKRYETTGRIDAAYFGSLSLEAVPYVLELQRKHPKVEGTANVLETWKNRLPAPSERSVFSFNISEWRAAKALQAAP